MWEFLSDSLGDKIFEYKYKKLIKENLEYKKLEEKLSDKIDILTKEVERNKQYEQMINEINSIYDFKKSTSKKEIIL
jgi:ethanolamine utilization protein EutA (predicted chaperonin)